MTGPFAEVAMLMMLLIAVCIVMAVAVCMYAYRQGRRLRRWNDRYRRDVFRGAKPLRGRNRWSPGGPAWR